MKATSMERLLKKGDWWNVKKQGWPSFVCFQGNEIQFLLMREDNKGFIDKALANGLRCYQRIEDNNYQLLKVKDGRLSCHEDN